jgi:hypothetical protein
LIVYLLTVIKNILTKVFHSVFHLIVSFYFKVDLMEEMVHLSSTLKEKRANSGKICLTHPYTPAGLKELSLRVVFDWMN